MRGRYDGVMYWRLSQIPELQHLSDRERKQLFRMHIKWFTRFWLVVRAMAGGFVLAMPITLLLHLLIKNLVSDQATQVLFYVFPMLLIAGTLLVYQFFMIRIRAEMRIYLQEAKRSGEKLPVCVKCGYAIHGTSRTCPECGAAV